MKTTEDYQAGDILIVTPYDTDDPVALGLTGMRGQFHRVHHSGHIVLKMLETERFIFFRPQDVRKYEVEK